MTFDLCGSPSLENTFKELDSLKSAIVEAQSSTLFNGGYVFRAIPEADIGGHTIQQREKGSGALFTCKNCDFRVAYETEGLPESKCRVLHAWAHGHALEVPCEESE